MELARPLEQVEIHHSYQLRYNDSDRSSGEVRGGRTSTTIPSELSTVLSDLLLLGIDHLQLDHLTVKTTSERLAHRKNAHRRAIDQHARDMLHERLVPCTGCVCLTSVQSSPCCMAVTRTSQPKRR